MKDSPLKIELSEYIKSKCNTVIETEQNKKEMDLLRKINIDGIITTNWDTFLESIFPDFRVFIGQEELLFSAPQSIAEIYKIHGCCTRPNSLVLTGEDYRLFNERNKYLAAKLLTIFIEHPIIFMGYSITDKNIQEILNSILLCLTNDNIHKLKDTLVFVEYDKDVAEAEMSSSNLVTSEGKNLPMTIIRTNDFSKIYEALISVERKFPARLLRFMKEHVYELVKTNDPKGKLYVVDIDDETDTSNIEVVFGVGTIATISEIGYKSIKAIDLFKDLIQDGNTLKPDLVLDALPELTKGSIKHIPIFKYLRNAGHISEDGEIIRVDELNSKVIELSKRNYESFQPSEYYKRKAKDVHGKEMGVKEIWTNDLRQALNYIPLLSPEQMSTDELEKILRENIHLVDYRKKISQR